MGKVNTAAFAQHLAERDQLVGIGKPSVPMMMRHRAAGSLPLRAEVTASDGYAHFE
jgi:hypothetical protein